MNKMDAEKEMQLNLLSIFLQILNSNNTRFSTLYEFLIKFEGFRKY